MNTAHNKRRLDLKSALNPSLAIEKEARAEKYILLLKGCDPCERLKFRNSRRGGWDHKTGLCSVYFFLAQLALV